MNARLSILVLLLASATGCSGQSSTELKSSEPITDKSLTDQKWCQTSNEKLNAGEAGERAITIHHRLIFDPKGFVTWQDWGKDSVIDEKNMRLYNCHQNSPVTLVCNTEQKASVVNFQVTSAILNLDGGIVEGVKQFSPCTQAENDGFDRP